jgi:outer membrane protein assembly factor BamB
MKFQLRVSLLLCAIVLFFSPAQAQPTDSHVQPGGGNFKNNPAVLSPVILQRPIYECARTVVVNGYIPNATVQIFVAGNPTPIGSAVATETSNQSIQISIPFASGQVISAIQTFDGVDSSPSNSATVTSYKHDYPAGLPQPRIGPVPCYECGRTVGVADVIPGAWWKVFAEDPLPGGGFSPPVEVGGNADSSHTLVNSPFKVGQRLTVQSGICNDTSTISRPEIVRPQPALLPPPALADAIYEGGDIVVALGPGGTPLLNGAEVRVFAGNAKPGATQVGSQRTSGRTQQIRITPAATAGSYRATQALCTPSSPGPQTLVKPCSQLPPAKIRQPMAGDAVVDVFDFIPGSRITVYKGVEEIGDGSGFKIALTQRVTDGDKITVTQSIGSCVGDLVYVTTVGCGDRDPKVCSSEWPAFRHSGLRDGQQPFDSPLADPEKVKTLKVKWTFTTPSPRRAFRASPIVHKGRVYIGNANGRLYALDAATKQELWQYPPEGASPLLSRYEEIGRHNASAEGLPASAAIGTVNGRDAVIFGGPDRSIGAGFGSGRLFALDAVTGAELWKSPEIADLHGITPNSTTELHENIGYSSPLVLGDRIYIGIANHADSPIQNGRVVAVDTNLGAIVKSFVFKSTDTRGGGIWSSLAGGLETDAIFATTGNARTWHKCHAIPPPPGQETPCQPEPAIDHSLSLLRLNAGTGAVEWKLKPVPFHLDDDPDWASGPTLLTARCGNVVASTQKDGWSYSVISSPGPNVAAAARWQFPPTGIPFMSGTHGDTKYLIPGAAWNDTFITTTGGHVVESGDALRGLTRLHALDTCGDPFNPVRWIADIPETIRGKDYQLGPPTITRGIVFVGTSNGHLVVLADPTVWPADGSVCSYPEISNADCEANGFTLVPRPKILAKVDLDPRDHDDAILTEPVLADGRVFVATKAGRLYMLEPDK